PIYQFQHRHMPEVRLTAFPLDDRKTNGVFIQRFMVTPKKTVNRKTQSLTILGVLKLICKHNAKKMVRCVSFYLVSPEAKTQSKQNSNKPKRQLPIQPPPPMVIKIKIQEIKDDTISVFGGTSKRFDEINLESDNSTKGKKKKSGK